MKRIFDIIISLIAIIVFCIPMILICIGIKLNSAGPILFKQKRIGKNSSQFTIYKFRTMKTDTPDIATEELENPGAYMTSFGQFLRKTSLDELPQLFNIIKGDMSIVGPRPALYNQYQLIAMREAVGVNSIRPGLTGFAQILGRDFLSDEKKVEYDEYYLQNQTLLLDLLIIWRTVFKVVKAEGVKLK
jgi:O-antigen biosynthesis protein WbqP